MAKKEDQDWELFVAELEAERAKDDLRQRLFDVLSSHSDDVEQLKPYEVADEVNDDLAQAGFHTRRSLSVNWEVDDEPQQSFIDLVATDPQTQYTAVLQFDFDVPRRDHVEAINYHSPAPDLAIFVLTRRHKPLPKLATAVRDVTADFVVYGLAQGGKTLLTPAQRDRLLEKRQAR